jgi:hypothetical protein
VSSELRQAFRRWASRPAVALTAIVTVALGIGTATAIFSVVDGVVLRPLPWEDPDRLVTAWIVRPQLRASPLFSAAWDRGAPSRGPSSAISNGAAARSSGSPSGLRNRC